MTASSTALRSEAPDKPVEAHPPARQNHATPTAGSHRPPFKPCILTRKHDHIRCTLRSSHPRCPPCVQEQAAWEARPCRLLCMMNDSDSPHAQPSESSTTGLNVDPAAETPSSSGSRGKSARGMIICPYCGHVQPKAGRCHDCGGLFEPLSRKATQVSMGPWTIRDRRQPFRPGCSYDVLVSMAKAGRIKGTTILRGPTTRQFWTLARNAPGVAHLVGYCHQCGHHVEGTEDACPKCQTPFRAVKVRDHLGLMFPHNADARRAAGTRTATAWYVSG